MKKKKQGKESVIATVFGIYRFRQSTKKMVEEADRELWD